MPSASTTIPLLAVIGATSLAACGSPTRPPNAEPFTPPAVYVRWWQMTEQCSGVSGKLDAIQWFRTPGSELIHNGESVTAYWSKRDNLIVIAEDYVRHGLVVRHEMLHALLGSVRHPRAAFLNSCGAVVDCSGTCVEDAESWSPQPPFSIVPPESLSVTATSVVLPAERDGERFVQLRVEVENSRDRAAVVSVPGFEQTPPTFGYDVRGPTGGISSNVRGEDSSMVFFAPREKKEKVFEFFVHPPLTQLSVPPGDYQIRGGYGLHWSPFQPLVIVQ